MNEWVISVLDTYLTPLEMRIAAAESTRTWQKHVFIIFQCWHCRLKLFEYLSLKECKENFSPLSKFIDHECSKAVSNTIGRNVQLRHEYQPMHQYNLNRISKKIWFFCSSSSIKKVEIIPRYQHFEMILWRLLLISCLAMAVSSDPTEPTQEPNSPEESVTLPDTAAPTTDSSIVSIDDSSNAEKFLGNCGNQRISVHSAHIYKRVRRSGKKWNYQTDFSCRTLRPTRTSRFVAKWSVCLHGTIGTFAHHFECDEC